MNWLAVIGRSLPAARLKPGPPDRRHAGRDLFSHAVWFYELESGESSQAVDPETVTLSFFLVCFWGGYKLLYWLEKQK